MDFLELFLLNFLFLEQYFDFFGLSLNGLGYLDVLLVGHVYSILAAHGVELSADVVNLLGVISEELLLRELGIDLGLVLNALRAVSILKGTDSLVERDRGRRDRGNDAGLCAATKRILKESSEFGLAVRDVLRLVDQSGDDTTKGEQALVDHTSFLATSSLSRHTATTDVFRTSQVDEVELADLEEVLTFNVALLHVNRDGEDAVRAARLFVEGGLGGGALLPALLEDVEDVAGIVDVDVRESANSDGAGGARWILENL